MRELGRIERLLFILDCLQSVELRRRVQIGLDKGEAHDALARAVFVYPLGDIRDRSFEQQRYRASGQVEITCGRRELITAPFAPTRLPPAVWPGPASHPLQDHRNALPDADAHGA